jgi:hypothetical protein
VIKVGVVGKVAIWSSARIGRFPWNNGKFPGMTEPSKGYHNLRKNDDLIAVQQGEVLTWIGQAEEGIEWIQK